MPCVTRLLLLFKESLQLLWSAEACFRFANRSLLRYADIWEASFLSIKRKQASALHTIAVLLLLFIPALAHARQVTVSFWVSGGAEGILDGGRVAPGWIGLLSQLGDRPQDEPWIDVGGTRHLDALQEIQSFRLPEAIVPGETLLRIKGFSFLEKFPAKWVVTNVGLLPQFPDQQLPLNPSWEWTHPDGGSLRVLSAWSDQLPLHVPSDRLRPLMVTPAMEGIRSMYIKPHDALEVLVIPEGEDGSVWSKTFPDADVVILPPGGAPRVIEVAKGNRIRVRPGMHGRSVIRVWAKWDTVEKTFSSPKAELVWVRQPDYAKIDLSEELSALIRELGSGDVLKDVDVIWMPEVKRMKTETTRPDGIRAQRVPQDDSWMIVQVPSAHWSEWKKVPGARWRWLSDSKPRSPRVALPARVVAGRGVWDCPIRQGILTGDVTGTWLPTTTRDLLNSEMSSIFK